MPDETRRRVAAALEEHEPTRLQEDEKLVARAAVTLVLRPAETASSGDGPDAGEGLAADLLFIQRAEFDGDPWSGHMALPGGRREPQDADLRATAIRELEEETALVLSRESILGRLDERVPGNPALPAIGITPYVAWFEGPDTFVPSEEVSDHVWVPLRVLFDEGHRSTLRLEHRGVTRKLPTIEYDGYTIWGITFKIVEGFLGLVAAR